MTLEKSSMARVAVLLLSLFVQISVYADKKEDLLRDAISRGPAPDGTYCIINRERKNVKILDMRKFVLSKGYYALDGEKENPNIVNSRLVKLYIVKAEDFDDYIYYTMVGEKPKTKPVTAKMYLLKFKDTHTIVGLKREKWQGDQAEVLWYGKVVNGFAEGKGVGILRQKGNSFCSSYEGEFEKGFPVSKTTVKRVKLEAGWKDWVQMDKKTFTTVEFEAPTIKFYYESIPYVDKKTKPVLDQCIAQMYKKDIAKLDNISKSIQSVTTSNYKEIREDNFVKEFSQYYMFAEYDPQHYVPKAREISDAYIILRGMKLDINRKYKSSMTHYESLVGDKEFLDNVMSKINKWQSEGKCGLGKFYTVAHSIMDPKMKEINKRYGAYMESQMRDKIAKDIEDEEINNIPIPSYTKEDRTTSSDLASDDKLATIWLLRFNDGTYSHVGYYVDSKNHEYYYKCISLKNIWSYKSFEDAAAASYVAQKYGKVRKKGQGYSRLK